MLYRRKKGVQLCFPIVYGNSTVKLEESSTEFKHLKHTHRWTVYVRGSNKEDISYYVQKVVFKLHDSFENPTRTITSFPFELTETGWGEFEVHMSVFLKDGLDRPIKLTHMLRLFPLDEDQLLQERIYQCVTKTAHKKSFIPLLMVEQMDEIVINEPTEAFYDFVLEKFKTDTYPLKGPVFNHKLEMQELDRLKKSQKQVNQLIEQYKWKLKEIEERSLSSQKAKTASYSSSTGSSPTIPTHHEVESQLDMKIK